MKTRRHIGSLTAIAVSLLTLTCSAGTYKHITIDGDFSDWAGVPVAYTQPADTTLSIAYTNIYVANDENYLYIRFAIATSDNPFTSFQNIFLDTDNDTATGYLAQGYVGSEMLIQGGSGYDERNGGFNSGTVNGLGWQAAPAAPAMEFEVSIARNATFASDGSLVFTNETIALLLESEDSSYTPQERVPAVVGGLPYTFAEPPSALTTNLALITLANTPGRRTAPAATWGRPGLIKPTTDTQAAWVVRPRPLRLHAHACGLSTDTDRADQRCPTRITSAVTLIGTTCPTTWRSSSPTTSAMGRSITSTVSRSTGCGCRLAR